MRYCPPVGAEKEKESDHMAIRPVFVSGLGGNLCRRTMVEFTYHNGLSKAQRQRSALSLGQAFMRERPEYKVLEISSFSDKDLGVALSAFNLMLTLEDGRKVSVECAYQAGKVFQSGGPYTDLLDGTSKAAKKDPRLISSGPLTKFSFDGYDFPLNPKGCFYNWLYIRSLSQNIDLAEQIMEYDAFTDIVYNPEKTVSCQAEACAYFVSLTKCGLLEEALKSPEDFIRIVYLQDIHSSILKKAFGTSSTAIHSAPSSKCQKPTDSSKPESEKAAESFSSVLKPGDKIEHPKFGIGEVTDVEVHDTSARVTISFPGGTKSLDEKWILAKCKKI